MRVTNKFLARHYADRNKRFFGNRLPKDMVVRFGNTKDKDGECLGFCAVKWGRPLYIVISRRLRWSRSLTMATLDHEMVHVALPHIAHGPKFHKRMLQLAKAGAFREWW